MKTFLLFVLLVIAATGSAQTADEVVNKFLLASGGSENLTSIKTLQYSQLIKLKSPIGDIEIPLRYFKDNNKLFRLQSSLQMGTQILDFFTVVSDTAGYVMLPSNPMMGMEGGLKKMTVKERMQQSYQMDAAGLFSTLVNYAEKGHKVELMKEVKIDNAECYTLKHTLATGSDIVYFINKASNLVVRMDAKGVMAASMSGLGTVLGGMGGGRIDKMEVSTLYADYKEFDGVRFPTKIIIKSSFGDLQSEISNIQINKPIAAGLYQPQ